MDYDIWVKSIKQTNDADLRIDFLKEMQEHIKAAKIIIHNDPKVIFNCFRDLIIENQTPKELQEILKTLER